MAYYNENGCDIDVHLWAANEQCAIIACADVTQAIAGIHSNI